jgi:hypothetical protein
MKQQSKLTQQQQQAAAQQQQSEAQTVREFASAEELLRYDAARTKVPPTIAQKLQQTVGTPPAPNRSWWRRLLGGPNS